MYIRVEVHPEKFVLYRLSTPEFFIGSSPISHITLKAPSLSKKHVKIVESEGQWFAIDQGSTNGTFLNDVQLVPGKKTAIADEDTLRLGEDVYVHFSDQALEGAIEIPALVSPTQPVAPAPQDDRTRTLSLTEMINAKTKSQEKKAKELLARKKEEEARKKKEQNLKRYQSLALWLVFLLGGSSAGFFYLTSSEEEVASQPIVLKKRRKKVTPRDVATTPAVVSFFTREEIQAHLVGPKCDVDEVKVICESSQIYQEHNNGIALIPNPLSYLYFLEEEDQMLLAKKILPLDSILDQESLQFLAFLRFFKVETRTLAEEAVYYFNFYRSSEKVATLTHVYALKGIDAKNLQVELKHLELSGPDNEVRAKIAKLRTYFKFY